MEEQQVCNGVVVPGKRQEIRRKGNNHVCMYVWKRLVVGEQYHPYFYYSVRVGVRTRIPVAREQGLGNNQKKNILL
jgi:hypothetical protein